MNIQAVILEQVDWDGTSRSFQIQADYHKRDMWVAFPHEYDDDRFGAFHFMDKKYENIFRSSERECRKRKLPKEHFYNNGDTFHFTSIWNKIPTERQSLTYYALYLPEYAIPENISIYDTYSPDRTFRKNVYRDDKKNRFVVYLECSSSFGEFNFKLVSEFYFNKEEFYNYQYKDEKTVEFYSNVDNWEYLVPKESKDKIHDFFSQSNHYWDTFPNNKLALQKTGILFLSANPHGSTLRLDQEMREAEHQITRVSKIRDNFKFRKIVATRIIDLQQELLDDTPTIVHFSGHGSEEGIYMTDLSGNYQIVQSEPLARLFSLFANKIKCVFLNSCYSEHQAIEINKYIPYVIGMNKAVPDNVAVQFSTTFYQAIASEKEFEFAYEVAKNSVELYGLHGSDIPILHKK